MNAPTPVRPAKGLLIKLAVLAVLGLIAVVLVLRGFDVRAIVSHVLQWIQEVGPIAFFIAMTLLPAFGFPLLAFTLSVGPAFAPQLGMPLLLGLVTVSVLLNIALTYWLARHALRPLLTGVIKRMGYQLPQVAAEDHVSLIVMARVTPGIPFFVQGYLLGLAEVPFRLYMLLSGAIAVPMAISLIIFAESLMSGKGRTALFAFGLVVAIFVAIQWVRRSLRRKTRVAS